MIQALANANMYGRIGWRLPSIGEIASILSSSCSTYVTAVVNGYYLSETPYGYTGCCSYIYGANPITRQIAQLAIGTGNNGYVWPVRSGQ